MKCNCLLYIFFLLTSVLSAQGRYDVIIDEIMSGPSPQVGLPNNEWIELKNNSAVPVNLLGWRIADNGGQSGPMPDFILAPDSFVIVCAAGSVPALSSFGNIIPVSSFPSLDNEGEMLLLKGPHGQVIYAVDYSSAWYRNELKKAGGWTLEMIDTNNPCMGNNNWQASNHLTGGTPGMINSIDAVKEDPAGPQLKNAFSMNDTTIVLVFDEPLDSVSAVAISNYNMDGGITFASAEVLLPLFNQVQLITNSPLSPNSIYTILVSNITDCKGNLVENATTARVGLAVDPIAGDMVINEILFNPRSNANDYVEFYNNSNKILDAAKLYVASRNSSMAISSSTAISSHPFYIFPGDYVAITENIDNLGLHYLLQNPEAILSPASLPSFPDDKGFVVLLNQQGDIVDEVNYSEDWHFKLLDNPEGVSLERIDPNGLSQQAVNWHSAASTVGYGTPGYKNSQQNNLQVTIAGITITPKIFSPDNDGLDDIASIQYKVDEPGYVANIIIFDAAGRPKRNLVKNGILSTSGSWNWDGLDDRGLKLPVGIYIIFTQIFNLQGKNERFKNILVLARKLN